jgi:UDP-N-acetylmuramate dehydrogenase
MKPTSLQDLGIKIEERALLADYTTFQLGGRCHRLFHCETPQQLVAAVRQLNAEKRRFILIGGGSNLVVSDQGLDVDVIRYCSPKPLVRREKNDLIVSAATALDALALFAANEALEGLNCTTGIPGTVGGAVVGNAGAFGRQVGDVLRSVTLLSLGGHQSEARPEDLDFRYRHSNLKERDEIVVEARFGLVPADRTALLAQREEILETRRAKHPDLKTHPCAGSFFRNIEPTSKAGHRQAAGWFLEQAGAKTFSVGGAMIFEKHANIIVKANGCTAQNVRDLSEKMARAVKDKFQLELVREVRFVGKFEKMPEAADLIW